MHGGGGTWLGLVAESTNAPAPPYSLPARCGRSVSSPPQRRRLQLPRFLTKGDAACKPTLASRGGAYGAKMEDGGARMLQKVVGAATHGSPCRYKRSPTLLHTAGRAASQVCWRCYTRPAVLLHKFGGAATHGRPRRYNWYNSVALMFLANFSGEVGFATTAKSDLLLLFYISLLQLFCISAISSPASPRRGRFFYNSKKKSCYNFCVFLLL
jgi:hypothetical protein